ncbi:MAG TPA: hypothetical protein VH234_00145 [Candidatus Saccharimonadales bacterium]|jgi:hypothetical protein|nr:hypothetical protein [Candidatus Saccharimonadales bacterium]
MKLIFRVLARRHTWQLIIILVLDGLIFGASNSRSVPSFLLMIGFLLLLATFYQLFYGLLSLVRLYGLKFKRPNRLALYFTGTVGLLVALQSIGELSLRDVVVLLLLAGLGYLYSAYGIEGMVPSG